MSEKVRVGIVGAGGNTKAKHIPGFQAMKGVSVDVVCNRTLDSSQAVADAFGISRIAGKWEDVVADPQIDAVCIGTWPYLHAPIAIAALKAGKHVLTEARMAMNSLEAQAMLEAARAQPRCVAQVVPSPFSLKFDQTIARIVESGKIGALREVRFNLSLGANVDERSPLNWRQNVEYSGNNTLMLGIYYEPIQRWIRREPARILAQGSIFTGERLNPETGEWAVVKVPETITMVGEYECGMRLVGQMSGLELGSGMNEYALCGSRGTLRLDLREETLFKTTLDTDEEEVQIAPEEAESWNVEADFIDSIRKGAPVRLTSFADGVAYMRVTDAAIKSIEADSAWVDV